jgi:hypothetical protein
MEELLDNKYPRLKDKTMLISWLVADAWEQMKEVEKVFAEGQK